MTQGTIKTIRDDRGFGFIKPDAGNQDIFFHSSSVDGIRFDELREGDRVEFTEGTDTRNADRKRAENVRLVGDSSLAGQLAGYVAADNQD
jgi:CspA family cold shock protein